LRSQRSRSLFMVFKRLIVRTYRAVASST
jgi:hypothetical protein